MSDGDIRELSDEDRKLCRKASADSETGTESLLEPQDGGDDDLADSDLYDTDVETLATGEIYILLFILSLSSSYLFSEINNIQV